MAEALIYQPDKNAMQSGRAGTTHWVLKIKPEAPHMTDPLMGWVSAPNTVRQLKLTFDTKDEAVRYAEKHQIHYEVIEPKQRKILPKSYADNFRYDRPDA